MKKFLFLGIICLNYAIEYSEVNDETFEKLELDEIAYFSIQRLYEEFRHQINYDNQLKLFMKYEEKERERIDSESYSELISLREERDSSRRRVKTEEEKNEIIDVLTRMEEWNIRQNSKSANFFAREKAIASQCQANIFNSLILSKLSDEELEKATGYKISRIIPDDEPVKVNLGLPQKSAATIKHEKIFKSKTENFLAREKAIASQLDKGNFDYTQLCKLSDEELEKATGQKIPRIISDDEPVKVDLGLPQKSAAANCKKTHNDDPQLRTLLPEINPSNNDQKQFGIISSDKTLPNNNQQLVKVAETLCQPLDDNPSNDENKNLTILRGKTLHDRKQIHHEPLPSNPSNNKSSNESGGFFLASSITAITAAFAGISYVWCKNKNKKNKVKIDDEDFNDKKKRIQN